MGLGILCLRMGLKIVCLGPSPFESCPGLAQVGVQLEALLWVDPSRLHFAGPVAPEASGHLKARMMNL